MNALVFFYEAVLGVRLGEFEAVRVRRLEDVRKALSVEETRVELAQMKDAPGLPVGLVGLVP